MQAFEMLEAVFDDGILAPRNGHRRIGTPAFQAR